MVFESAVDLRESVESDEWAAFARTLERMFKRFDVTMESGIDERNVQDGER